jgi:NHL repeat
MNGRRHPEGTPFAVHRVGADRSSSNYGPNALHLRLAVFGAALIVAMLSAVAVAHAQEGVSAFYGGPGHEGGQFGLSSGNGGISLAINQSGAGGTSAGDLYIADQSNDRVEVLTSGGEFVRAFGLDVGGPGIDLCTEAARCAAGTESGAAGGMSRPEGIAIDQGNGNVYVTDYGNRRVDIFSAVGAFEGAFGWDVSAGAGAEELQFCTEVTGCKAGSAGGGAGQFAVETNASKIGGIAINASTDEVVVASTENRRVDEFSQTLSGSTVTGVAFVRAFGWGVLNGAAEAQTCSAVCRSGYVPPGTGGALYEQGLGRLGAPEAITVGSGGTIYVADIELNRVATFEADGTPIGSFVSQPAGFAIRGPEGIALDETGGRWLTWWFDGGVGSSVGVQYFDQAGARQQQVSIPGQPLLPEGIAVYEATGQVFLYGNIHVNAQTSVNGVMAIGTQVPPVVAVDQPSMNTGISATLSGTVNPTGVYATYRFEYSTDGVHWTEAHDPVEEEEIKEEEKQTEHLTRRDIAPAQVQVPVTQRTLGLEARTTYHLRLTGEKLLGAGSATGETTFITGPAVPIVSRVAATAITADSAVLTGSVNPENEAAVYRFQCTTQSAFESGEWSGATELPADGGQIPASGEAESVSASFSGLSALARYRCRLLASNATGEAAEIPSTTFVTFEPQPPGLPDGRVYEQATPTAKNGASAQGQKFLVRASGEGDAITYFISGGGSVGEGSQDFPSYVASREDGTWISHGLLPASSYGERAIVKGWSEDLARDYPLVWNSGTKATFYMRDIASGAMRVIASGLEPGSGAYFDGESANGDEVLFESNAVLAKGAHAGVYNLYLWNRTTGTLTLVDILSGVNGSPSGGFAGAYAWFTKNTKQSGTAFGAYTSSLHALSEDGATAFFTTPNVAQLYARRNLTSASPETLTVSASKKTNGSGPGGADPQGAKPAAFMEAAPDGRYVFFTSQSELTNDATTGTADQGNDLYRFDTETGDLVDIAPDPTDEDGAEVQAVLGSSPDGSVYFVANGALASGATVGSCHSGPATGFLALPEFTGCNVYLYREGAMSFVARIGETVLEQNNWIPEATGGGLGQAQRTGQVGGGALIFAASQQLTSYANAGQTEIYRYAPGQGLRCLSCAPSGQGPPANGATLFSIKVPFAAPVIPSPALVRNITDEGRRVFFESDEQLVPEDVNGVRDVYEWEADGTGSCASSGQNGGCVYLISTGTSPQPSFLADASANGNDVFFFTKQALVGQDQDELQDIYDARVSGGISAQNPARTVPCLGDACRQSSSAASETATPATPTFTGPGNPKQPKSCHKGFVRKGKKCVKKATKKHGLHRRSGHKVASAHHKSKEHKRAGGKNRSRHHGDGGKSK